MLEIKLPATDDAPAYKLKLEHSLASLSKWESFYEKAWFAQEGTLSHDETLKYFEFMVTNDDPPDDFVDRLTVEDMTNIINYLPKRNSATWFRPVEQQNSREVTTTELIHHWMMELEIPPYWRFENLNRLLTMIKVRTIKKTAENQNQKMNPKQRQAEYARLNAERRAKYNSAG